MVTRNLLHIGYFAHHRVRSLPEVEMTELFSGTTAGFISYSNTALHDIVNQSLVVIVFKLPEQLRAKQ